MEALELSREDYVGGLAAVAEASGDGAYMDRFKVRLPEGLNTASALEICRLVQSPDLDARVRLARICLRGKPCEIDLPDGKVGKFVLSDESDSFDAFPVFSEHPLALLAVVDAIYGFVLKKSVRPLSAPETDAKTV